MKISDIARKLGCELRTREDVEILRVTGIEEAGPGDLTFVSNRKYVRHIKTTCASAIILGYDMPEVSVPSLRTANPYLAFARALELFYRPLAPAEGIHPTALIAPDARMGVRPSIGAYAVIESGCVIGDRCTIYPHVVLYAGVVVGDDACLHSHVVIRERCRIGDRVVIQNHSVVGSDGFGFAPQDDGTYYKIPQSGAVIVEDDVDIGAGAAIDRAAVGNTRIRRGAKIDNMVQIGHGSEVGEDAVLAAQVGLAGSTRIGRRVQAAGQVGFAGHLTVGEGAVITAQSGVPHDIPAGAVMSGYPAMENPAWRRSVTLFGHLPELMKRVRDLEKQVELLKAATGKGEGKKA
ncbi:MAG: UDP-3-O-(3-hydroxymyristoyl)glucosamine N-acyltransferase [Acidobacteria bacterium]|nr:UDP-3-O-(3-hydroxymyristoyl)glucosamine N-acyltransferase [Acidobacteriota bacterium]